MRAEHLVQLRNLIGQVSAAYHEELVILAQVASEAAERGSLSEHQHFLNEYEHALRSVHRDLDKVTGQEDVRAVHSNQSSLDTDAGNSHSERASVLRQ
ncbi:hypothetical protein C5E11_00665 [Clavibacter michiganensis]|nr:hypothetical protein C5E11_00665 [Clavibacter michiganensis]